MIEFGFCFSLTAPELFINLNLYHDYFGGLVLQRKNLLWESLVLLHLFLCLGLVAQLIHSLENR